MTTPRLRVVPPLGFWKRRSLYFLMVEKGKRALLITCTRQRRDVWHAVALEVARASANFEDVANDHGHENLGKHATLQDAQHAAEDYAAKWLRRRTRKKPCVCDSITQPQKKGTSR